MLEPCVLICGVMQLFAAIQGIASLILVLAALSAAVRGLPQNWCVASREGILARIES